MSAALLIIHDAMAGVLFYTCFCRAIYMDNERTSYGVLFAFWILGLASVVMIAAPVVAHWQPTIPTLILLGAIIFVQIVTSRYWHAGVPKAFRADPHENAG